MTRAGGHEQFWPSYYFDRARSRSVHPSMQESAARPSLYKTENQWQP
jgi:hypothetical protein